MRALLICPGKALCPPSPPPSPHAGLIPKLVQERLRTEAPYTPLLPEEISSVPVPPPPQPDAYLKSRVDKFYAQLAVRVGVRVGVGGGGGGGGGPMCVFCEEWEHSLTTHLALPPPSPPPSGPPPWYAVQRC
jgi:hypothetical protein